MVKKTRGSLMVGLCMVVGISCLNSHFYGQIAGRLPFQPWGMVQNLTHYGIESPDITLCSVTFIFVISQASVGTYFKKILALEGPRVSNPDMPQWMK